MRMVLYGLPCAAKDELVSRMDFVEHISESEWLGTHSDVDPSELALEELGDLRRRFIKEIMDHQEDIAVDTCFSIPSGDGFRTVFTDDDAGCFDVFVYVDLAADLIRDSIKGCARTRPSIEYIESWRDSEISELQSVCMALGKEFIIFDPKYDASLEFLRGLFDGSILTAPQVARIAADRILAATDSRVILISDGDKTLTDYDLTRSLDVPILIDLIDVFERDRYTTFQFWAVYRLYRDIPDLDQRKRRTAEAAVFNRALLDDLGQIDSYRVVVTGGNEDLWAYAAARTGVFGMVVGADTEAHRNMSQFGKALIVRYLHDAGRYVIALGDEVVDLRMLEEADRGYLIAHLKTNPSVQAAVSGGTNLKQPSSNEVLFDGVQVVGSIHEDAAADLNALMK